MTRVSIRPYVPADIEACVHVFDAAWHSGHPYAPRRIDRAAFERETLGERVLVADVGVPGVVGFVGIYEPSQFIHHLYVDPARHRLGIGRALLAEAVALAGGKASLKCQRRNPSALAFYRHLGWHPGEEGEAETGPWVRMHSP